ncbi:MAG: hypothetical protein RL259_586 [Bacteroidota bacterium]|jgi:hypothetical protein
MTTQNYIQLFPKKLFIYCAFFIVGLLGFIGCKVQQPCPDVFHEADTATELHYLIDTLQVHDTVVNAYDTARIETPKAKATATYNYGKIHLNLTQKPDSCPEITKYIKDTKVIKPQPKIIEVPAKIKWYEKALIYSGAFFWVVVVISLIIGKLKFRR